MQQSASTLTEAQLARIAENREKAAKRRAEKERDRQQQNQAIQRQQPPIQRSASQATAAQAPRIPPTASSSAVSAPPRTIAPIFQRRDPTRIDSTCVIRTKNGPITSGFSASLSAPKNGAGINDHVRVNSNHRADPPDKVVSISVTICPINTERFKVIFMPFHNDIVEALKKVSSRSYDHESRCWMFSMKDYQTAKKVLKELQSVRTTISDIPDYVLRAFDNVKKNTAKIEEEKLVEKVGKTLYNKLFPYQREGLKFGVEKSGRVIIADEMGLGKSIQALAIAKFYRNEWPLLIVCPSTVKFSWKGQIEQFLPFVPPEDIMVVDKSKDMLPFSRSTTTVVIISYDLLNLKLKQVLDYKFYVLIFDECHVLKDSKTKRAMSANELGKVAKRTILLSGTPALSRPAELFSQIRVVDPKLFSNFRKFAERYCDGKEGRFGYESKGATNTEELATVLFSCIMIRRLKKNLLHELPSKVREIVYLSGDALTNELKKLQKAKEAFENAANSSKADGQRSMMEFYAQTGCAKAKAVSNHIMEKYFDENSEKRKVIIFAHHQMVLDTLCYNVEKKGLKYIRIDGGTKNREEQCRLFQENPEYVVAVLGITAAGTGITLTAATVVVFAELHWNPGTLMQAEDRAHRVGQKDSVFVQYLLARGTADDLIWPLVQRKIAVLGSVNLSSENFRGTASTNIHVPSAGTSQITSPRSTKSSILTKKLPLPKEHVFDLL
ncbi:hypothetical protein L596_018627 [Steinernema carpocapsae]|uniref:SWI/SNF-related matrix-associated actin-dependent regulator of chromatin subfamily A-like protein 1 n=1 Tax=Steinernema carpocapsae TaxID=34508 RepID=A0A4V6A234_STECR|nr:hypothetical protein L596_018627 [Steinernema carpocapsae]